MHRIDTQGSINGKFSDGHANDPDKPTHGTVLNADWLNAVQEEIVSFIGGEKRLRKGVNSQMTERFLKLMDAASHDITVLAKSIDYRSEKNNPEYPELKLAKLIKKIESEK